MSIPVPIKAFILAGGAGRRLRPYTETTPKPLLPIGGQTLLERTLKNAYHAGVRDIYISLYFRVDQFKSHIDTLGLPSDMHITIITEDEALGTGGSIANAIAHMGAEPFFVLQTNIIWDEVHYSALRDLANLFDEDRMDAVTLVVPRTHAQYYHGNGDYTLDTSTQLLHYNSTPKKVDHVAGGIRLIHPRLFAEAPDGAFPFSSVLGQAERANRLYGLEYHGDWWAIDTKEQFLAAQRHFAKSTI